MDVSFDKDWKTKVGFQINFKSDQSSEEDADATDVVMRRPMRPRRSTDYLLDDAGDGSEADLLSSTPPRALIRKKEKSRRGIYVKSNTDEAGLQKMVRDHRRNTTVYVSANDNTVIPERLKKRWSLKRSTDREWKQEMGHLGNKADSLPSPEAPAVPTLVESCSRFMSLTSRLKCRQSDRCPASAPERPPDALPDSRVTFHQTFSMLINMGNVDKSCRRAISREEQVWQNELKDLIWLELQAKIAGRTLAQQDEFLCSQRNIIPTLIKNIIDYRFVNPNPCKGRSQRLCANDGSREDLSNVEQEENCDTEGKLGCLSFDCRLCSAAIGAAMTEVRALLDAFHRASALYPSTQAMTSDHKLLATSLFQNRIKAMCLWYNMAMHMRLKILSVRRLLQTISSKGKPRLPDFTCISCNEDQMANELNRQCSQRQVRFNITGNPTDSSNSEASSHSEKNQSESEKEPPDQSAAGADAADQSAADADATDQSEARDPPDRDSLGPTVDVKKGKDETDCVLTEQNGQTTPEIVISDAKYSTSDTTASSESGYSSERERWCRSDSVFNVGSLADLTQLRLLEKCQVSPYRYQVQYSDTTASSESGYSSERERWCRSDSVFNVGSLADLTQLRLLEKCQVSPYRYQVQYSDTTASSESGYSSERERWCRSDSVFNVGSLADLTQLRLLEKCQVSPYRDYHYEMLKTQGVRRCMMFIHKLRKKLLTKVYHTFLQPEALDNTGSEEPMEVSDTKDDDKSQKAKIAQDEYELRRYGCWSEESLDMRLPSYRSHFLLLSSICMEAVHDYLAMRLEGRPEHPSCLTIKQLIHELKEGLDIATKMRQAFVRHIEAALRGHGAGAAARQDLLLVIRTFDASVEDVFKQYLSYLTKISSVEHIPRSSLEAEWAFVARVAERGRWAKELAPQAFTEIACNQLNRVMTQLDSKFKLLDQVDKQSSDPNRYVFYTICREAQSVFASEREAALQAAAWARALAAHYWRACPDARRARRRLYESLMAFRACIVKHTMMILERASQAPPDEFLHEVTDGVVARVRDLLLQVYRLGFEIHKELHRFVNERYGRRAAAGRPWLLRSDSVTEEEPGEGLFGDLQCDETQSLVSIEQLLSGEPPPPPAPRAARAPCPDEEAWSAAVARAIVAFARCWMRFVMERCERGRGRRPRWASQGLEFLMLACDPYNTRHLSEEEFEELKQLMDGCISHVVGSRSSAPRTQEPEPATPRPRHRLHSPLPSSGRGAPAPPTPPTEPEPAPNFNAIEPSAHTRRVLEAVKKLDASRDAALREMKAVGRVAEAAVASYEPRMRQVTFKWQRGLKIGAGTFGKVYTVVNTETGQLLAMKEINIGAGDRRAMQRAANELRVLEGALHPHLVRYYGIEVHREEMLIFMELCVEGSLEALVATSGALPEQTVRRYTAQLLGAIAELHARNIAHRDIKSGNIFLTNEGHCLKLGDFGCAVKIRATNTAAGELQGYVGTQAYMAPEVFMKSSGHGRATDIWSLGCVVTEMASGKRPFSEYDSNYQIMFVVGMGGRPDIPESLSEEGHDFCRICLTHEPDKRPRAEALSLHTFLMVKDDDCHDCKPGKFL